MIRRIVYIILIILVFFAPVNRVDVGSLQPVEIISIYNGINHEITIETDTGDIGRGKSVHDALLDLKATAPAVIYLDTAEFLLVEDCLEGQIKAMSQYLKQSVRICFISGKIDLQDAAIFLRAHGDFPKIKDWKLGEKLPILTSEKILSKSRK